MCVAHITSTPSSIVANQDPEATRELWESKGAFSTYWLNFRGTNNILERFLRNAVWRDHQGIVGYYAESHNFPSGGLIAVKINLNHLCWVEVCWRHRDSQWEAFCAAAADLRLNIGLSDLNKEEHNRLLPISDSEEGEAGQSTRNAFTTHREPSTSPPFVATQGNQVRTYQTSLKQWLHKPRR